MENLDPGERQGELLFGLIMVLTFTLGAGIGLGGDEEATRELLIAALGCNAAWGIIDAALYLMNRLSERGRTHRLLRAIQAAPRPGAGARARGHSARRVALAWLRASLGCFVRSTLGFASGRAPAALARVGL